MQSARLDELQAGIKIASGNNNNLRYADDTTLMAESKEELKSLLMRVKRGVLLGMALPLAGEGTEAGVRSPH